MMSRWLASLAILALAMTVATATQVTKDQGKQEGKEFAMKVAETNLLEVKLGELAAQRASNADVKQFGQQMVDDHRRAAKSLQESVGRDVALPRDLNKQQQGHVERLGKLTGAEFDREYMRFMVEGHQKAIEMFERQSKTGEDAQLKAYATRTLPELRKHLERAQEIQKKLK